MSTLRSLFGRRLRQLRLQRNLTQERLAEDAGVSVDLISNIERGVNAPSFETMEKLAASLHVSVKDLFVFTNEVRVKRSL